VLDFALTLGISTTTRPHLTRIPRDHPTKFIGTNRKFCICQRTPTSDLYIRCNGVNTEKCNGWVHAHCCPDLVGKTEVELRTIRSYVCEECATEDNQIKKRPLAPPTQADKPSPAPTADVVVETKRRSPASKYLSGNTARSQLRRDLYINELFGGSTLPPEQAKEGSAFSHVSTSGGLELIKEDSQVINGENTVPLMEKSVNNDFVVRWILARVRQFPVLVHSYPTQLVRRICFFQN